MSTMIPEPFGNDQPRIFCYIVFFFHEGWFQLHVPSSWCNKCYTGEGIWGGGELCSICKTIIRKMCRCWWYQYALLCHQIETFSALLGLCEGNPPVPHVIINITKCCVPKSIPFCIPLYYRKINSYPNFWDRSLQRDSLALTNHTKPNNNDPRCSLVFMRADPKSQFHNKTNTMLSVVSWQINTFLCMTPPAQEKYHIRCITPINVIHQHLDTGFLFSCNDCND